MDDLLHAAHLSDIVFPIFKIGTHKPIVENGLVFYYQERETLVGDDLVKSNRYKLVDDRNLSGDTLARRRLQLAADNVPLAKLSNALYFLGDFIKLADPKLWFIDSKGKVFNYKRSTRAKLKFYKIAQLIPIKTGGVIVEAEGILQRFKALYAPSNNEAYVGILHFGMGTILYGFYSEKHDETWRLI